MNFDQIHKEIYFKTSRSSGKGGQNVNKLETRVELYFDILNSEAVDNDEKTRLLSVLQNKLSKSGVLKISAQQGRTQLINKNEALKKLFLLLKKSLHKQKKRIATKPTKASKESRINSKKKRSEKKEFRKKIL
jgi:ribosome-associated protein